MPRLSEEKARTLGRAARYGHAVYLLLDPISGDVRYVGCTSNIYSRATDHQCTSDYETPVEKWKRDLRDMGLRPKMVLLGSFTHRVKARGLEWELIHVLSQHFALLNTLEGSTKETQACV